MKANMNFLNNKRMKIINRIGRNNDTTLDLLIANILKAHKKNFKK